MATALSPETTTADEKCVSWIDEDKHGDESSSRWNKSPLSSISTDSAASWSEVEHIMELYNVTSDEDDDDDTDLKLKRTTYVQEQAAAFDYFQKINGVQQLGRYVPGSLENELSSSSDEQDLTFGNGNERERLVERLQELAGDMFLVDDTLLEELMDLVPIGDREALRKTVSRPTYPIGESANTECEVCFERKDLKRRPCCRVAVCNTCLVTFIKTQVTQGIVKISCVMCSNCIPRDEIMDKLDKQMKEKFYKFLIDANKDPSTKTCPRCSHITKLESIPVVNKKKSAKMGMKIECESCSLEWCFPCQAPWHEGVSCQDYIRGDKMLKAWAREHQYGQINAQKCPKCKVYIQRSSGCDHMTCSRCKTNFCYKCGERFRELRFIGDHYSKLSVFGCKFRFKPNHPTQRKLIRGAILGGKLMAAPLVGGLALGAGAVLLGVGVVVLPFYGGYKLHNRIQRHKEYKRNLRDRQEWMKRLEEMRQRGAASCPYLEQWNYIRSLRAAQGGENPISGPVYSNLFGEYSAMDIHNPHRQSVDLNMHDMSLDSDTVSYLSLGDGEDSIAVAQVQVDSYQLDRDLAEAQVDVSDINPTLTANASVKDSSQYFDASDASKESASVNLQEGNRYSANVSVFETPETAECKSPVSDERSGKKSQQEAPKGTVKAGCSTAGKVNKDVSSIPDAESDRHKLKFKRLNCYKRKGAEKVNAEPKLEKFQEIEPQFECVGSVELKRKSYAQIYV